jgi:hypothetical protein
MTIFEVVENGPVDLGRGTFFSCGKQQAQAQATP